MTLFVYGELCKPAVLLGVLGRVPVAEAALVSGFHRRLNPDTGYFFAEPRAGALLPGVVLDDIAEAEMQILDRFENVARGEYRRVEVTAQTLSTGEELAAWIYVAG